MRKKQNTRRDIAESVHRIYAAGLYVTAGFIIGSSCRKSSGSLCDGKSTGAPFRKSSSGMDSHRKAELLHR